MRRGKLRSFLSRQINGVIKRSWRDAWRQESRSSEHYGTFKIVFMDSSPTVERGLYFMCYDVRCRKAPYSVYIIIKSYVRSYRVRELVDSRAIVTLEDYDEVSAFYFKFARRTR